MTEHKKNTKREHLLKIFAIVVVAVSVFFGVYYWLVLSRHINTDNAYVNAEISQVTALVEGIVKNVRVHDTQAVEQGDILVELNDADAKLSLTQAQATLKKASADYKRAEADYLRQEALYKTGAVSNEKFIAAENDKLAAEAAVQSAEATLSQAQLDLERTVIYAPIKGIVAKRQVQLGQRTQVGSQLMWIVPLDAVHVDANFKEAQLKHLKVGHQATLTSDFYGDQVMFHGKVVGLSGGTGAAFSIIPAQNATGNWIKVVQRLPVRIALDPGELAAHPLRVGLSMVVDINISEVPSDQSVK